MHRVRGRWRIAPGVLVSIVAFMAQIVGYYATKWGGAQGAGLKRFNAELAENAEITKKSAGSVVKSFEISKYLGWMK